MDYKWLGGCAKGEVRGGAEVFTMIHGVAFDLEGTVIDVESLHFESFVLAAREGGLELNYESIVRQIPHAIGGGDQVIAEGICKMSGGRLPVDLLIEKKGRYYMRFMEEAKITCRPGFVEAFNQIVGAGFPVAIGSLTPANQAKILLARSGVGRMFDPDMIVLLEDVKRRKPAPDVFLETARRMKIDAAEQLVFEDSSVGIKAARAAGSRAVALPVHVMEENLVELIRAGASRIFMGWDEMNVSAVLTHLSR